VISQRRMHAATLFPTEVDLHLRQGAPKCRCQ